MYTAHKMHNYFRINDERWREENLAINEVMKETLMTFVEELTALAIVQEEDDGCAQGEFCVVAIMRDKSTFCIMSRMGLYDIAGFDPTPVDYFRWMSGVYGAGFWNQVIAEFREHFPAIAEVLETISNENPELLAKLGGEVRASLKNEAASRADELAELKTKYTQ
jgi:hypothetical protein